jgi:molecular chaperone HtpG
VISDYAYREEAAKLLRFESSKTEAGIFTSLADYVERMPEGQKEIFYINGPSREAIENGPYIEAFKKRNLEVIYTLEPIDDFAMSHLGAFAEKKLVSADRGDLDLPEAVTETEADKEKAQSEAMDAKESESLTGWMKEVLGEQVKEVIASKRLTDSPAMVVNPDGFVTSSMERIMRASGQGLQQFGGKNLEINTSHPLIKGLAGLKEKDAEVAHSVVEQIFDNAMIQAGLMVEPRNMVARSYRILERLVEK